MENREAEKKKASPVPDGDTRPDKHTETTPANGPHRTPDKGEESAKTIASEKEEDLTINRKSDVDSADDFRDA
jgi:hypothetical protein